MSLSQVRLVPDRLAICRDRLVGLALARQRVTKVAIGASHVGVVNANGLAICGNRLVELALRSQRIAEVGMGRSEVGLDPDRAPICRDRLVELALAHQRVAEPKMALGKIRLHCSYLPITRLGRDPLSSLVEPHSGRQQLSGWGTQFCNSAIAVPGS